MTCLKSLFLICTYIDLYVYAHMFMWCVVYVIMYMGICCVGIHWHKQENTLSFVWMRKWILVNEISTLWNFAMGATSWDYAGATSLGPTCREVPRMVQSAAQRKVPHCIIYILLKENVKVWKRQKEILWICFRYFEMIMAYHLLHYV